ncbi:MAG TPA: hypothetical protein VFQ72_01995 [Candidatus Paceibacterota bacterium]|nr:hypothetical protein [Candidatus Paceibacterota bacterium]
MRKFLPQFLLATTALVGVGFFFAPHEAHAFEAIDTLVKFLTFSSDIVYGTLGKLFWFGTVPITSFVLWLVGMMIDLATNLSLTNNFFNAPAIATAWSIIRDLCNMVFIFVLIWAGLRTILNLGNAVTVKKTITGVVIAALFINFSLFITKAIIDVSNIGTAWFVKGVENVGGGTSVSDSVRSVLQMNKLVENKDAGKGAWSLQSFVAGFALTILNCVAIYVLFKVAFFLVARIVSFFFLLVTAPLGFVGGLEIPQLSAYSKKWWDELRNQALMAPMFFLMLYITLYIVDQVDALVFANGAASSVDPVTGSGFTPANYVMFAIIVLMLNKCLSTAEEYSGELGGQIAGYLKSATSFVGGAALMGTVGRAATWAKNNKSFQSLAGRSAIAGALYGGTTKVAESGFGVKSNYNQLAKSTGLSSIDLTKNAFKGADSYEKQRKFEIDEKKKFAKTLGKGPEGEANRIAYANRLDKGVYAQTVGRLTGDKANLKEAAKDMAKDAKTAMTKGVKDDAKKKATAKQNQVVVAETVQGMLKKPMNSADVGEVDKAAKSGKKLLAELRKDLKEENKDDYLKFVSGYEESKGRIDPESKADKIGIDIARLQTEKMEAEWALNRNPKDRDAEKKFSEVNAKIAEKTKEKEEAAAQESKQRERFAELAKKITAEDRKEAAKKFSGISAKEWTKIAEQQVAYEDEIIKNIDAAEKALDNALEKAEYIGTKKENLMEAQKALETVIGKTPKFKGGKKGQPREIDKDNPGSGLKKQAADLKEKFNDKNKELTIGKDEPEKKEEKPPEAAPSK